MYFKGIYAAREKVVFLEERPSVAVREAFCHAGCCLQSSGASEVRARFESVPWGLTVTGDWSKIS